MGDLLESDSGSEFSSLDERESAQTQTIDAAFRGVLHILCTLGGDSAYFSRSSWEPVNDGP